MNFFSTMSIVFSLALCFCAVTCTTGRALNRADVQALQAEDEPDDRAETADVLKVPDYVKPGKEACDRMTEEFESRVLILANMQRKIDPSSVVSIVETKCIDRTFIGDFIMSNVRSDGVKESSFYKVGMSITDSGEIGSSVIETGVYSDDN